MRIIALLSLRTVAEHRSRYVLGGVAVAAAVGFMVAGRMVTEALAAQMRAVGADDSGTSGELFLLLSLFGLIVIVASGFVITNSFQTLVAARTRELALLRTVGLRTRQGFVAVVLEGLMIGSAGSLVGLGAGTVAAWAIITPTMEGAPIVMPGLGGVALAIVVGLGVTLAAVLAPAYRATRVAPIEALASAETISGDPLSLSRTAGGAVVLALGAGIALAPLGQGPSALVAFVAGALVTFVGLSLLGPAAVPLVSRMLAFGSARGPVWRMASGNLVRGRRRSANTAMAVALGVTLFTGVNVVLGSVIAAAEAEGYDQSNVGQVFLLAFGLTGLTVVVGIIGVLNTVVLSVRERERELALLRAVGMTAREVQRTLTVEGAAIAFVGVGLGAVFGIAGAAVLLDRLGDSMGVVPPWGVLGAVLVGSLVLVTACTHLIGGRAASCPPVSAAA